MSREYVYRRVLLRVEEVVLVGLASQLGYHGYRMTTKAALGRAAHLLIVDKLITTPTRNGRRHTCSPWVEGLASHELIGHIHRVYLLRIIHVSVNNL